MRIKTTYRKVMEKAFFDTLKKVMEKWSEPKDVLAWVKIAEKMKQEVGIFNEAMKQLEASFGYEIEPGRKSANPQEITDFLLRRYGRLLPDGNLTIAGAAKSEFEEFSLKKEDADKAIRAHHEEREKLLDTEVEIEIPRKVVVDEKAIRKEIISAHDCHILSPILDLSKVSDFKEEDEEV